MARVVPDSADATVSSLVRFGAFVFDLATGELTKQGRRIALQDQPARVLALFIKRAGHVVTRDEVRRALWPEGTFVDFEAAIAVAINKARRALGDSASRPRFIETIPKHGYRFLADVRPVTQPAFSRPAPQPEPAKPVRPLSVSMLVVAVLLTIAAVFGAVCSTRLASNNGSAPASIAIRPFRVDGTGLRPNVGSQVAEAIAKRVSPLSGVHVMPWIDLRPPEADAVLEGELRASGDRIDVTVELIRTDDGSRRWQEHFNVPQAEITSIENRVTERLASRLNLPLSDAERARLSRRSTASVDAYRWYLEGRWFLERRTPRDLRAAVAAFKRATESDPSYALAYAWLGNAYGMLTYMGSVPPWEGGSFTTAAADRALQLDPGLAEANLIAAGALGFFRWRWTEADALFRKALELDSNYAEGRHWYAVYLEIVGRLDDALRQRRLAHDLAPDSTFLAIGLGEYFMYARQPQHAVSEAEKLLGRNPASPTALGLRGRAYVQLGRFEPAIADLKLAHAANPEGAVIHAALISALAGAGRDREARAHVDAVVKRAREQYVSPYEIGVMYTALGDREEAFRWLAKACDIKDSRLATIRMSPRVDRLRADPRFKTSLVCVGLD